MPSLGLTTELNVTGSGVVVHNLQNNIETMRMRNESSLGIGCDCDSIALQ